VRPPIETKLRSPHFAELSGREVRELSRAGEFTGPTAGAASEYVQANLVILPQAWAADFERFCKLNPKPCPLLEVTEPGSYEAKRIASGSDLRTDLPAYRVYLNGELVERCTSIERYWDVPPSLSKRGLGEVSHSESSLDAKGEKDHPPLSPLGKGGGAQRESLRFRDSLRSLDSLRSPAARTEVRGSNDVTQRESLRSRTSDGDRLVAFLIGCSFTFEQALIDAGIPVRHIEENRNVPMFRTNRECVPAGKFSGPLVVSMRPMTPEQADAAARITERMPQAHGAPVHVGDSAALGILDLTRPDYGDAVTFRAGEVPVFWACGVTPMEAIMRARPPVAITHDPGHMFVTDLKYRELLT